MKYTQIVFLAVICLLGLLGISCIGGGTQLGGWAGVTVHDGIIYAGTLDGRVVAINATSRDLQWSRPIVTEPSGGLACDPGPVPAAIYTTPIVVGDFIYVGTYTTHGGRMYALGITDGEIIWEYPKGGAYIGAIVGRPDIDNGIMYVTSSDSTVYALDINRNGLEEWKSEILDEKGERHEKLWTSPVVYDGAVYVSTFDGHIYALSVETGELLEWSFKLEAGFASSPVIYEDTIFSGSFDRHLYAVKMGSDVPLWKFPRENPAGNWFWASPVVNEGIVYAGCLDGKLYAIEAKTGEKLWDFNAGNPIVSSPVLMGRLLITVDESGTVYVFDLDGELANEAVPWRTIPIGAGVRSSFCVHEGLVYIRGEDNWIYVVDVDRGQVSWGFPLTIEE